MKIGLILSLALTISLVAAAATPPRPPPTIPTEGKALQTWLQAGHYKGWHAEPTVHDSDGPHFGNVRTYLNPQLARSLEMMNRAHPVGSAAVKELYGDSLTRVMGWAVEIKVTTGSDGHAWYWYERFGNTDYADGRGVEICADCHEVGEDYVLTDF